MPSAVFKRQFFILILLAWMVPAIFGLGYIVYIQLLSLEQMAVVMTQPLEPLFILVATSFALWYFWRYSRPLSSWLVDPLTVSPATIEARLNVFPQHFWGNFLAYLVVAPSTVVLSAELYTGFETRPVDWFRIHLVALVVAIIVGLPIFFRILDLFGKAFGSLRLTRPQVTLKAKVFLIAALTPLLIDTMIVQYYWTRTGYFSSETFVIWLGLEIIAVLGALMFTRSIAQSLRPLARMVDNLDAQSLGSLADLQPESTDELGVLTARFRDLLTAREAGTAMAAISNQLLQDASQADGFPDFADSLVRLTERVIPGDRVYLNLHDPACNELVAVAMTGAPYKPDGHFRLGLNEASLTAWSFRQRQTVVLSDVRNDPRISPRMLEQYPAQSVIVAPLWAGGEVIGTLMSTSAARPILYGEQDIELIGSLAREAALAIHARRLQAAQRSASLARQQQQEFIELLTASASEGIYTVNTEGLCTFVNPAALRMLGYERSEDLVGKNVHALIHHTYPDGQPYPKEECHVRIATVEGKTVHVADEVHWRRDGTSFPVEYWSHPMYRGDELVGAVVTFIDITERKRGEEALRESGERFRAMAEQSADWIWSLDTQGRHTYSNARVTDLLGYEMERFLGADVVSLVHPEDRDLFTATFEHALANRAGWQNVVLRWQHQTGRYVALESSARALFDEGGRLIGFQGVDRDITERKQAEERIQFMAHHDALTRLPNRILLRDRFKQAQAYAERDDSHVALLFLDLDNFKVINDSLGHAAGDRLLLVVVSRLTECVRDTDTVSRQGGDEFILLLNEIRDTETVERIVSDILRRLAEPITLDGHILNTSGSVGIALYPQDGDDFDTLLLKADTAMYKAKEAGRDTYRFFDEKMNVQARDHLLLQHRLRQALENGEFRLHFQPQLDIVFDRIFGVEALLRWNSPDLGEVPPSRFIPVAEESGLIVPIGNWVLEEACRQAAAWRAAGLPELSVSINLSAVQFRRHKLLAEVAGALEKNRLPPHLLELELTESILLQDVERTLETVHKLKALGVRLVIDEFGTGFSSLGYLKRFAVDKLKIAQTFVQGVEHDTEAAAIVRAIIQLANSLGVGNLAEGVETQAQLDFLRQEGCPQAQGYIVGEPQSVEDLERLLRASAT